MTIADLHDPYRVVPAPRKGFFVTVRPGGATLSAEAHAFLVNAGAHNRVRWLVRKDGRGFAMEGCWNGNDSYSLAARNTNFPPGLFADLGRLDRNSVRIPLAIRDTRLVGYFPD